MNFKINNINFAAKYEVFGKQTSAQTRDFYDKSIAKLTAQRQAAVHGQKYFETEEIQAKIHQLPADTFVRLHTAVTNNYGKSKDKVENYMPLVRFETISNDDRKAMKDKYGEQFDEFKFSFDSNGDLEKEKINNWLDRIIEYYANK